MNPTTKLEPLSEYRARELAKLLADASARPDVVLVLDGNGRVLGTAPEGGEAEHAVGDFDVHA